MSPEEKQDTPQPKLLWLSKKTSSEFWLGGERSWIVRSFTKGRLVIYRKIIHILHLFILPHVRSTLDWVSKAPISFLGAFQSSTWPLYFRLFEVMEKRSNMLVICGFCAIKRKSWACLEISWLCLHTFRNKPYGGFFKAPFSMFIPKPRGPWALHQWRHPFSV